MTQSPVLEPMAPERARRLLPIAANLLPTEVVESRRARKVRRSVLIAIVALVVLLTGWYGYAVYETSVAREGLAGAQADVDRAQKKQAQFNDLVQVQSQSAAIHAQLSAVMAEDLPWSSVTGPVLAKVPNGMHLKQVTANLPDLSKAATPTVALPNTSGQKLIGTLTVEGQSPNKALVAQYVDALAQVKGLANPYVTSAVPNSDETAIVFTIQFDVTDAVLGGRFTPTKK